MQRCVEAEGKSKEAMTLPRLCSFPDCVLQFLFSSGSEDVGSRGEGRKNKEERDRMAKLQMQTRTMAFSLQGVTQRGTNGPSYGNPILWRSFSETKKKRSPSALRLREILSLH